jgi:hypothetical protein
MILKSSRVAYTNVFNVLKLFIARLSNNIMQFLTHGVLIDVISRLSALHIVSCLLKEIVITLQILLIVSCFLTPPSASTLLT